MLVEDQRFLHEDLERLEQAISDRVLDDPKNVRRLCIFTLTTANITRSASGSRATTK